MKPDLEAKLSRLASEQGRDRESLVVEAIERMFNYDEWFVQEVSNRLRNNAIEILRILHGAQVWPT